jgi:hypothetical protein
MAAPPAARDDGSSPSCPRDLAEAQAAARTAEKTIPFQADYARRAGVALGTPDFSAVLDDSAFSTTDGVQTFTAIHVCGVRLPAGEAFLREITGQDYDVAAPVIPGGDPELADAALAGLLIAAGRDGAWHQGWVDAGTGWPLHDAAEFSDHAFRELGRGWKLWSWGGRWWGGTRSALCSAAA